MTQQNEKPVCKTCNGERMVGGWSGGAASIDGGGSYENHPCPDCTPTYDQLSALCAQMAAELELAKSVMLATAGLASTPTTIDVALRDHADRVELTLTAYRTLSPDPQWQRVPEGCVVVPEELSDDALTVIGTMNGYDIDGGTADTDHREWWAGALRHVRRARGEG